MALLLIERNGILLRVHARICSERACPRRALSETHLIDTYPRLDISAYPSRSAKSGIAPRCSPNLGNGEASLVSCTADEIYLSVAFAADVRPYDVKGILAARISWTHPSEHSLSEQPQDRSAVLENNP